MSYSSVGVQLTEKSPIYMCSIQQNQKGNIHTGAFNMKNAWKVGKFNNPPRTHTHTVLHAVNGRASCGWRCIVVHFTGAAFAKASSTVRKKADVLGYECQTRRAMHIKLYIYIPFVLHFVITNILNSCTALFTVYVCVCGSRCTEVLTAHFFECTSEHISVKWYSTYSDWKKHTHTLTLNGRKTYHQATNEHMMRLAHEPHSESNWIHFSWCSLCAPKNAAQNAWWDTTNQVSCAFACAMHKRRLNKWSFAGAWWVCGDAFAYIRRRWGDWK